MPLYHFAQDNKPGDTNGQGVGTVWYTVSTTGQMVKGAQSVPATGGYGSNGSYGSAATSTAPSAATSAATATPAANAPAAAGAATVSMATDTKLGKILVDGKGMTLYVYTKDKPDTSTCTGGCAKVWPPFLANGSPVAGMDLDPSMLGTATLADGSKIVTYNHMPLYYWKGDTQPGDTAGQGVGGVWFVVGPDGKPVMQSSTGY